MKPELKAMNSRLHNEEWINILEYRVMEITHSEEAKWKILNESKVRNLWENIKHANLCIIEIPKGEKKERGIEILFGEIMAENFSNLKKEQISRYRRHKGSQVRWTQTDLCQDIIEMAKVKKRILNRQ